ncbi:RlpA-like double-psi beta-barrel domain-containing protein [Nocardia sp. CC227C]|uniref:RlpA-like double-psi beta-barrel domain-containing protein n=1 Tax=Nocardia sp. CC227C TaxID=3044562 RepID=UPI00278C4E97|nr:RlpA-like double-psi beta-barrel domain-containing protein [Nocardia sp. CC227C]
MRGKSTAAGAAALAALVFGAPAHAQTEFSVKGGWAGWYNYAGYGACGTAINAESQLLAAVPTALWTTADSNDDPLCQRGVEVTYEGRTIRAPILDRCVSCAGDKIELSQAAFQILESDLGVGQIQVDWRVVSL